MLSMKYRTAFAMALAALILTACGRFSSRHHSIGGIRRAHCHHAGAPRRSSCQR